MKLVSSQRKFLFSERNGARSSRKILRKICLIPLFFPSRLAGEEKGNSCDPLSCCKKLNLEASILMSCKALWHCQIIKNRIFQSYACTRAAFAKSHWFYSSRNSTVQLSDRSASDENDYELLDALLLLLSQSALLITNHLYKFLNGPATKQ